MSRKLGFKFDKYKRWLEGSKILRWEEFVELCNVVNLDINGAIDKVRINNAGNNFFSYLKMINSFESSQEVANYLNTHVSVVKRYALGETSPDTETIFKMIDNTPNYLTAFLTGLFPAGVKVPALNDLIVEEVNEVNFQKTNENISIVRACFELETYAQRRVSTDAWISEITKIPQEEVRLIINELVKLKLLIPDGDDNYKFSSEQLHTRSTSFKDGIPSLKSFNSKAYEYLSLKYAEENPTSRPGLMAKQVYPVSHETLKKVNNILIKAYADMAREIEEDKDPRVEIVCGLFQLFPLVRSQATEAASPGV
jgi:hypothetical protein